MYTQCPKCGISFRVTAEVLKQASGKVRCGNCRNAFNALLYLSETRPDVEPQEKVDETLPELQPEPLDSSNRQQTLKKMSPEQSAALLKTLDELAGTDIQLEDTGVEWRLLDESNALGETEVDQILSDTPTQIDELLEDAPADVEANEVFADHDTAVEPEAGEVFENLDNDVEAAEVFEDPESSVESAEVFEESATPVAEELRFDDNTGLPEDFDFEAEPAVQAEPEPEPQPEPEVAETADTEIALGDPEEWGELLDEVAEPEGDPLTDSAENDAEEEPGDSEAAAIEVEEPADVDDASPEHGEDPLPAQEFRGEIIEPEPSDEPSASMSFADEIAALPDIDDDEIDAEVDGNIAAEPADALGEDLPPDIDTQFDLQAETMGIDLSGVHKIDDEDIDPLDRSIEEDLIAAAFESEDPDEAQPGHDADELELVVDDGPDTEVPDPKLEREPSSTEASGELEMELARAQDIIDELEASGAFAVEENAMPEDDPLSDSAENDADAEPGDSEAAAIEVEELAAGAVEDAPVEFDEPGEAVEQAANDTDVPPPTPEEQTVNMQIDRDLMRFAVEDDEGFTSTIVFQSKKRPVDEVLDEPEHDSAGDEDLPTLPPAGEQDENVEAIIMEGDFVRTALEEEALREIRESGAIDEDEFAKAAKETFYGKLNATKSGLIKNRMIAGALVLVLLLILQLVHQWRAELARVPAFNSIIAPIYSAVGAPITPDWDVTAWRFEKTVGSTSQPVADQATTADDIAAADTDSADNAGPTTATVDAQTIDATPPPENETLTIYSRIGNTSEYPLPYPLISVSLTDRFEEIIGSSILEPADYLTGTADSTARVAAGQSFDAVIAIESPSAEATGFKLNVCYRQTSEQLRCAIEDFK